jgi:hypothetical protein
VFGWKDKDFYTLVECRLWIDNKHKKAPVGSMLPQGAYYLAPMSDDMKKLTIHVHQLSNSRIA